MPLFLLRLLAKGNEEVPTGIYRRASALIGGQYELDARDLQHARILWLPMRAD
jgi:hypothetical protein